MTPGSAVSVIRSLIFSSAATAATPSGIPTPRLTTLFGLSSIAARRAMILRSLISSGFSEVSGTRTSEENAALYCVLYVCR